MNKKICPKPKAALIISIMLCLCAAMGFFSVRIPSVNDEVWSYTLSNKYDSPFFFVVYPGTGGVPPPKAGSWFNIREHETYKEYFGHWHDSKYYLDALSVQPDQRFAYEIVYRNQALDVHPPLYYFILHTICSFFPDKYSPWFAFSINLFFYAVSLLFIWLIARKILASEYLAITAVLLWGLSAAGINETLLLRMYLMLSCFMLIQTYLTALLIGNFKRRYVLGIVIIDILGFLTQYYAYIYTFFLTLFTCIFFLCKKQWKKMFGYGFSVLFSVGAAILIFPEIFRHAFSGTYTDDVTNSILNFKYNRSAVYEMANWVTEYYAGISFYDAAYCVMCCIKIALFALSLAVIYRLDRMFREQGNLHTDMQSLKKIFLDIYGSLKAKPAAVPLRYKLLLLFLLIGCGAASDLSKRYIGFSLRDIIRFIAFYWFRIVIFIAAVVIIYHLILLLKKEGNIQIKLPSLKEFLPEFYRKAADRLRELWKTYFPKLKLRLQRLWRLFSPEYKIVFFSMILSAILIAHACPYNGNRFTARYIFVILPLFSVYIVHFIKKAPKAVIAVCRYLFPDIPKMPQIGFSPAKLTVLISAAFIIMSYRENLWFFGSFRSPDLDFYDFNEKAAGSNVIYVDKSEYSQTFAPLAIAANAVYPADDLNESLTQELNSYDSDIPLLLVCYSETVSKADTDRYLTQEANISHRFVRSYIYPFSVTVGKDMSMYLYELYPDRSSVYPEQKST